MRTTILLILVSLAFSLQAQQIEASIEKGSSVDVVLYLRSTTAYPFESIASPISFLFEINGFATTPVVSVVNDQIGFAVQGPFEYSGKEYIYFTSNADFDLSTVPSGFTSYLQFDLSNKDGDESLQLLTELPGAPTIFSKVIRGGINQLVIVEDLVALPVDLTIFTAEAIDQQHALLKWETAGELNNDHFEVQHSTDGILFTTIGQVRGAGTTTNTSNYRYVHIDPADGYNYYRLKQVDYDNASEYSDIKAIFFASEEQDSDFIKVFPNPTVDRLILTTGESEGDPAIIHIVDIKGRQIKSLEIPAFFGTKTVDVSGLATGKYYLQLQTEAEVRSAAFLVIH
ncbi:MAG: T9SS type A sorting domain-containing protein [Lewinella sp.]|nr:T9SS type A sorting domain-containing protein [Lewinella sp.]